MKQRRVLVRDADAAETMELLLVASVLSVLVIRTFLAATGYPTVGGETLHIAHMLWGGLSMLAALILLLSYWNRAVRWFAAFLAGIGFGTFIDELGKFLTHDNDYFYRPTVALLYIIFVALFFLLRSLHRVRPLSPEETRLNEGLRDLLGGVDPERATRLSWYFSIRERAIASYERLVARPWFRTAVTGTLVVMALLQCAAVLAVILSRRWADPTMPWVQGLAVAASTACMGIGAVRLTRSRLAAYRWFQRGFLVSLLVTQVFLFLANQFAALWGLAKDLLFYGALRFMIEREEEAERGPSDASPAQLPAAGASTAGQSHR